MKVASGIVVRVARKALREIEVGRARASIVRERAEAMVLGMVNEVMARCDFGGGSESAADDNRNESDVIG